MSAATRGALGVGAAVDIVDGEETEAGVDVAVGDSVLDGSAAAQPATTVKTSGSARKCRARTPR
jgi:hypothetical protein